MDRVVCPDCGVKHDLSDLEPSYRWPDAYLAVPPEERDFRTIGGSDDCRVRDAEDLERRYFLRALLPIPIRGEAEPCCWGLWIEVDEPTFERVSELWDDPGQAAEPSLNGSLANELKGYNNTLGLPGCLQLTGPTTAPRFTIDPDVAHPLPQEQRLGVYPERVVEWLAGHCRNGPRAASDSTTA
jgi:hypothetical protein